MISRSLSSGLLLGREGLSSYRLNGADPTLGSG
jgi:hypothetical protein